MGCVRDKLGPAQRDLTRPSSPISRSFDGTRRFGIISAIVLSKSSLHLCLARGHIPIDRSNHLAHHPINHPKQAHPLPGEDDTTIPRPPLARNNILRFVLTITSLNAHVRLYIIYIAPGKRSIRIGWVAALRSLEKRRCSRGPHNTARSIRSSSDVHVGEQSKYVDAQLVRSFVFLVVV